MTSLPSALGFRFLHLGLAVQAIEPATECLSALFGYKVISGPFDDPIQKVRVVFLALSDGDAVQIELIA